MPCEGQVVSNGAVQARFPIAPNTPRIRVSDIAWTGSVEKATELSHQRKRSIITKTTRAAAGKLDVKPSAPESRPTIEALRTFGREQGFTDEQMTNVLRRRLHHEDWDRLVPFNISLLKMIFQRGPAGW